MPIYKKQFASHDEYEEWLERAGGRIQVITVRTGEANAPATRGALVRRAVSITYQTVEKDLRTAPRRVFSALEAAIALIVLVGGIMWFAGYMYQTPEQPKLFKLDKP